MRYFVPLALASFVLTLVVSTLFVSTLFVPSMAATPSASDVANAKACLAPGSWYTLADGPAKPVPAQPLLADMARRDVVLLGEQHDNVDHHRWQLQTLAALHVQRPQMVIGFEAFPRRVQPVLDQWVAGQLTARQFLERVEWEKVWSFPSELYMPLFEFARLNRVPMIALNVERGLTAAVRKQGWDAVPAERKEGVSRPAPASPAYESYLFDVYNQHGSPHKNTVSRKDTAFRYFVESQTTWDRAMAEALASRVKAENPVRPLVIGIMGAGHVRHGHGVIHQLRDLAVPNPGTLIPVDSTAECAELKPGYADAVFAVPAATAKAEQAPPPRLGVQLELADGNVRVVAVTAGSLAEETGVRAGDRIVAIAGSPASSVGTVVAAVRGTLPGTWLPLQVRRGESNLDLIVKFPPKS
jgi:uncharacterized iron-regulated protein